MGTMESLVAAIEANTKAVEANTAAILAGGGAPAAGAKAADKPKTTAKKADEKKSSFTAEQVRDKFIELKDATDEATAKSTIEAQGVKKLAELVADPSKWDKAMADAQEKIDEAANGDDDGGL